MSQGVVWRRWSWVMVALVLVGLAATAAVFTFDAGQARASSAAERSALAAIVHRDGPSARSSPIVSTRSGDVALIARALHVVDNYHFEVGSHTVSDIFRYGGGTWHRVAEADFGRDSLGPNTFAPPQHVTLTGATDFKITLEAAGVSPVEFVSDASGSWRVVPFRKPGEPESDAELNVHVHDHEVTSEQNDCKPDCATGHRTQTTWAYDRASESFVPVTPGPTGPCEATLTVGPFRITATCLRRIGNEWQAKGSIKLDGVGIATDGGATLTVSPLSQSITATGDVSVTLGSIQIYRGALNLSLKGTASIGAKGKVKIKGLPISGNFNLTPTADGMQVTAFAGIDGFTGNLTMLVANDGSLDLKKLRLGLGNLPIKQLVVRAASLTYQQTSDGDTWIGDVKVALPGSLPVVDGTLTIFNGQINEVAVNVSEINKPIGEVVFLQSLGLDVVLHPHIDATGSIGLSGGPKLPVINSAAVALNASLEADFGQPVVLTAKGRITVGGSVQLADAEAVWTVPNKLAVSGDASFSLAGASAGFNGSGLVDQKGFYVYGQGSLSLPGHSDVKAFGYLSEKGVTSCGIFSAGPLNVLLGFGYHWGDKLPSLWFDSCGALDFKSASAGRVARAAAGAITVHVPASERQTLFGATGVGGYPSFVLRSPTGAVITPAAGSQGAIDHGGYLWLQDPDRLASYVAVARPTPGNWTLTALPGSAPVASVGSALSAPVPHVTTHLRRVGSRELLSWRARSIPGQQLRFLEVGGQIASPVTSTRRARGSVTFVPTAGGRSERRRIQIEVSVAGVPSAVLSGATFTVSAPRLGRPRIHLHRHGRRVTISWSRVRGATGYRTFVTVSDGRRLFFVSSARRRSITVGLVAATRRVTVSLQATGPGGDVGQAARARLAGHHSHRR